MDLNNISPVLAAAVAAFAVSWSGVAAMRRWTRYRILDIPNERSSHVQPTPRGAGLTVVITTILGLLIASTVSAREWSLGQLAVWILACAMVAGISWIDDLRSVPTMLRFIIHSVAAALAILAFGAFHSVSIPFAGELHLGLFTIPITLVWIVGLTNAYNFMDGIDGIAGSQAVVAGVSWAVFGSIVDQRTILILGTLIAASSSGFLVHNWPPARIFMGDVGSAFLGFAFAVMPLVVRPQSSYWPLVGALVVWPFVADTAFTFLRRLGRREAVFSAHRSHLYQRLVIAGASHRTVTLIYAALATGGCGLAFYVVAHDGAGANVAIILIAVLALSVWFAVLASESRSSSIRSS